MSAQVSRVLKLIRTGAALGYQFSLDDGECEAVPLSSTASDFKADLASTDMQCLSLFSDDGDYLGYFSLVYEYDGDADEVVQDCTSSPLIDALLAQAGFYS
jgi:hypothetical protein